MQRQKASKLKSFSPDDIQYAIRLATANATRAVEKIGGTAGLLTKKEFANTPEFQHLTIQQSRL